MDGLLGRLPEILRRTRLVTLSVLRSFRQNWGIALLSLGLAISLWVFVTDRENPDTTGGVPGTIPIEVVNVPANQAVFSVSEEMVSVRVRASESVFEGLTADDFRAVVDLSDVSAQRVTVDVRVESDEPRADVVDVSPADVLVVLEDVTSVAVPVAGRLVGTPPRGFDAGEIEVQPEEAVVTGPESLVERVSVVEADANLSGLTTDFEQTLLLQARGEGGANIDGVTVDPETAFVTVEITQQSFSANFAVLADVSGTPAPGFVVTGLSVEPQFVAVSSSPEILQELNETGVVTEPVIIDDANDNVVRPVGLRLPEGAQVLQPTVTVRISIEPIGAEEDQDQ